MSNQKLTQNFSRNQKRAVKFLGKKFENVSIISYPKGKLSPFITPFTRTTIDSEVKQKYSNENLVKQIFDPTLRPHTGLGTTIGGSLQSTNKNLILRLQRLEKWPWNGNFVSFQNMCNFKRLNYK